MPGYTGLFGLSGNVDDRRFQGNPYGDLTIASQASQRLQAPPYRSMNQFTPDMLPSALAAQWSDPYSPQGELILHAIEPQNKRPDPVWFQPPVQPPPIQNMDYQGRYVQPSALPINLFQGS